MFFLKKGLFFIRKTHFLKTQRASKIALQSLEFIIVIVVAAILSCCLQDSRPLSGNESTTLIYVMDNGIHTSIVLPARNKTMDWNALLDTSGTWPHAPYIGFGWGEKDFYINTPTWNDLQMNIAI